MVKKKLFVLVITLTLFLGAGNILAASLLDTNLIKLFQASIQSMKDSFLTSTEKEMAKLNQKYTNDLQNYINQRYQKMYEELEQHQYSELNRAEAELKHFVDTLKEESEAQFEQHLPNVKNEISKKVNDELLISKQLLIDELEKQIRSN